MPSPVISEPAVSRRKSRESRSGRVSTAMRESQLKRSNLVDAGARPALDPAYRLGRDEGDRPAGARRPGGAGAGRGAGAGADPDRDPGPRPRRRRQPGRLQDAARAAAWRRCSATRPSRSAGTSPARSPPSPPASPASGSATRSSACPGSRARPAPTRSSSPPRRATSPPSRGCCPSRRRGRCRWPGLTAWQIIVDTLNVQSGDDVLIHGAAGGVGHLAVQVAAARGATVDRDGAARAGRLPRRPRRGADDRLPRGELRRAGHRNRLGDRLPRQERRGLAAGAAAGRHPGLGPERRQARPRRRAGRRRASASPASWSSPTRPASRASMA